MTISKDLFLAILSMDAYNRGYGAGLADGVNVDPEGNDLDGLGVFGSEVGNARILTHDASAEAQAAGFYAIAYEIADGAGIDGLDTGDTVISYRGTDHPLSPSSAGIASTAAASTMISAMRL